MPAGRDGRPRIAASLRNGTGLTIELLENGSVFAIRHDEILVNQVLGSPVEGGLGNIHLRRRTRAGVSSFPLLGPASPSRFRPSSDRATWEGSADGLDYSCTLRLAARQPTWFWTVTVANATRRRLRLDALLSQDLGIAQEAAVRSSERYTSQYIDHTILEDDELGFLVCSRQNLAQDGAFPWVMHGCLDGAAGYLTDGFQFYGPAYKGTNVPAALERAPLPDRVLQYEFALPTLRSRTRSLAPGETADIPFFAAFEADHPAASSGEDAARASVATAAFRRLRPGAARRPALPRVVGLFDRPILFESQDLAPSELERRFGSGWRHVEWHDGTLRSFFHGRGQHVVLRAKEVATERPTGHIMRTGRDLLPSDDILSVTAWMLGVFGSQLTIGNTTYNKILGVCRDPLNVLKASGQRIFIRTARGYELLGVPSAFEMGPSSARWIYQDDRYSLTVRVATSLDAPVCRLSVRVERGGPLELLVSHDVILDANEYDSVPLVVVDQAAARVTLRPAPETLMARRYPSATFCIASPDVGSIEAIGRDGLLRADDAGRDGRHLVFRTKPISQLSLVLTGSLLDERRAEQLASAPDRAAEPWGARHAIDDARADDFREDLGRHSILGGASGPCADQLARLDDLVRWYITDAMIHYTAPHGLEQSSGAAWGTRDVCQGPVEFLIATGHTAPVRNVLRIVYEHQYRQSGDWPQWFMFDRYREVQAVESHGDVIHWPLKALCDYIEATGDLSILDEPVASTDDETLALTAETEPIFTHVERQIAKIERDCIPGTALAIFGGGDWEDTLQPADPEMARRLVSSWTVELAYQTLDRFRTVSERAGRRDMADRLAGLCARIRDDFNRYLVPDGVVAGLAHFGPGGIEYLIHPRDRKTGATYRLLPMTRGMLSGLFSVEQARRHVDLIGRHLTFPDGVRLMDRPMPYRGGTSRFFKRAETAANFGREVGLQYVHAHIRYIEAMARVGRPDAAFAGLMAICPIRLDLDVPSALPRQSNAYFSSSDAAFMDREEANRRFGRIRTGRVGVMGGWRVYSSGPGIFINVLISSVLGLRTYYDDVVFDPVLPRRADGLTFDRDHDGRRVRYLYHVAGAGFSPREVRVNGRSLPAVRYDDQPYRSGGLLVAGAAFDEALDRDDNLVEILV